MTESPYKEIKKPCPTCGEIVIFKEYENSSIYAYKCEKCDCIVSGGWKGSGGGGAGWQKVT